MNARPGQTIHLATGVNAAPAAGTLRLRLVRIGVAGGNAYGPSNAGIMPDTDNPLLFEATITLPSDFAAGSYSIGWDVGGNPWFDYETLVVSPALLGGSLRDDLRRMTGVGPAQYALGGVTYWSDEQLLDVLAANRVENIAVPVHVATRRGAPLLTARVGVNGTVAQDTESMLVTRAGVALTGWTIDRGGIITLTTDATADPPRWFTGWSYDLHAAAADVLDGWAAALVLGYDISTDGQSMSRSQRHTNLVAMADKYRARSLPASVVLKGDSVPSRRTWPGFE